MSDLISRQAAIDALENDKAALDKIIKGMSAEDMLLKCYVAQRNQVVYDIDAIKQLPPIQPANCSEFPNNSDTISRRASIDALNLQAEQMRTWAERYAEQRKGILTAVNIVEDMPTIQPDNGLQKLADEIESFKRCVKSENSDYLTGYLCALSAVEGMIAERIEVTT